MKPRNIKEFKALVERYESITLEEIEEKWIPSLNGRYNGYRVARNITGFGTTNTCSLCKAVTSEAGYNICIDCVYESNEACHARENNKTYDMIFEAKTSKQLLSAFRARAKHLRKTYPQYL